MTDLSRLPAPTRDSWDWQLSGACRDVDTAVFFHPVFERGRTRDHRVDQAKAICARCPVLVQCRDHALTVQEPYGTWGGLDEHERTRIIRQRRKEARNKAA